ncbi:MAG TPA: FxSxx-COOH system tetratricopeptide repeat protein [Kineosporiaceae bacterium]
MDFFVSHDTRDQAWAEWLAWQLIEAGYSVELDVWDWAPGQDYLTRMQQALDRADRLVAVWSEAYFRSTAGTAVLWASSFHPARDVERILPVLVEPVAVPNLYAALAPVDLVGLDEATAAGRLRDRLGGRWAARLPHTDSSTTTADRPTFAGRPPAVWNVPPRNPHFMDRTEVLNELRSQLRRGQHTMVLHALHGLGGVGKTQLALEYAHRFCSDYELVWWLDAEHRALIAGQLAALSGQLGLPATESMPVQVDRVRAELRRRSSWLLIFDNAQRPEDLIDYQPGGTGHVLVTSRYPGFGGLGGQLEVDVLARPQTVALLRRRVPDLAEEVADQLADELGDLPLAAAQAAGYLEVTGLPPEAYLRRFRRRRASLLAQGDVIGYQGRLDTAWTLSLERLRSDSPAGAQLMQLAAFLAPDPIPLRLFTQHAHLLDEPLRTAVGEPDELDDVVRMIVDLSLIRRHDDRVQLHRLVQAVIRSQLTPAEQHRGQERVLTLLCAGRPGDPNDPSTWGSYRELAPHVLATIPVADDRPASRELLLDVSGYLRAVGDGQAGREISAQLLDRWREILGADHPDTLASASLLANILFFLLGDTESARALGQDTVERGRRVLGHDHPTTLNAAATLSLALVWLAELEPARALGQDTLERCRRVLGPDHSTTLYLTAVLTLALIGLGEPGSARALAQDTLQRCRRVLGRNHSTTLFASAVLADALVRLGEPEPVRILGRDTLERSQRVLGPDHPTTLYAAAVLTTALIAVGEPESAYTLGQDTLERCRRAFGPDHATTLLTAATLTLSLIAVGQPESACTLGQDTLERCRRAYGPDHATTLLTAAALTLARTLVGEPERAGSLGRETLGRCRQVYGPDHAATLFSAAALTLALIGSGEPEQAGSLGRETLGRSRQAYGPDDPLTQLVTKIVGVIARPASVPD